MKKVLSILFVVLLLSISIVYAEESIDASEILDQIKGLYPELIDENNKPVSFTDITETHWAYSYVSSLAKQGVISGYDDNTFKPSNNISRAEFYKLMSSCMMELNISERFKAKDDTTPWYEYYMLYAYQHGFMTDMFGYGDPNEKITRKEMIVSLGRFASIPENTQFKDKDIIKNTFIDMNDSGISEDEMQYVDFAYTYGLVKGYDDNSFHPDSNLTRAEAATIVYRFLNGGEV